MAQQIQLMKPEVLVRFTNQLNTTAPLLATFRYASAQNNELATTAAYGTPPFVHLLKTLGALPVTASEYSERLERYKKELPEDHADRTIPPLMIEGRAEMPALLMPTTKAEEPAPAPPSVNAASLEGHMIPIDSTHPT